MKQERNNYAFIDAQNLHIAVSSLGWSIDYARFRTYLSEKYHVSTAYLFIGYVATQSDLYRSLQQHGFTLIFKPTLSYKDGTVKGNCDAELVLQTMIDYTQFNRAVIVTGDGDFHCLVKYLIGQGKLEKVLIPNQKSYSALLKRFPSEFLAFVSDLRNKLEYKKKKTS